MYKAGDILYDDNYGLTVTLLERFFKKNNKPAWKMLVNANELKYDESNVGDIIVCGEEHLISFFEPVDKRKIDNG